MEEEDALIINWRGTAIGALLNSEPDSFFLEGEWLSDKNPQSVEFENLVKGFNTDAVLQDGTKGTRIELTEPHDNGEEEPLNALVISLEDNVLLIKRVLLDEEVEWLLENVK